MNELRSKEDFLLYFTPEEYSNAPVYYKVLAKGLEIVENKLGDRLNIYEILSVIADYRDIFLSKVYKKGNNER